MQPHLVYRSFRQLSHENAGLSFLLWPCDLSLRRPADGALLALIEPPFVDTMLIYLLRRTMSSQNDNSEFDALVEQDQAQWIQEAIDSPVPVKWMDAKPVKAAAGIKRMRQVSFLKAFVECGNISQACDATGINVKTQRYWHKDQWYVEQYKDAYRQYCDRIEQEVHNRAIVGEEIPIIGKVQTPFGPEDKIIGHKRVKSDLLLMFHAKKHIPSYRDKFEQTEDKPVDTNNSPMARLLVRLDMISARQQAALPPQETVIDITPQKELPEMSTVDDVQQ